MENIEARNIPGEVIHFKRERINKLFMEATKYPLVIVSAGAGYGKTSAVHAFAKEYKASTIWVQLSERDNIGTRFWENCAHTVFPLHKPLAEAAIKLGFPDTPEKIRYFMSLVQEHVDKKRRIIVLDDFHYIQEPSVISFLEECIIQKMPPGTSVFLISRSSPQINIANMLSRGFIFNINENDLRFTENELSQYLRSLKIFPSQESIREIMQDTEGWVFAINLIAHSYQKAPGYGGYVRNAVKTNIFRMMEVEIWNGISKELQNFMLRLSLIAHLSIDLIALLAGENKNLIAEFEEQNSYVRRDNYINAYLIHPLFLEFLTKKQNLLTEKQKRETYAAAGRWCNKNGFKIDALSYFEKIGDYESISQVLFSLPLQIPRDIAKYASQILDKAPENAVTKIRHFASMHLSAYMAQGLWEEAVAIARRYEKKILKLPKDNPYRNQILSSIYNSWAYLRILICIKDDCFDFDKYFEKFSKFGSNQLDMIRVNNHGPGPWINAAGSSRKGSLQEFIDALERSTDAVAKYFNGLKTGDTDLAKGELKFYQGDIAAAETYIISGLEQGRENNQFEIIHRALFYLLRISFVRGNYKKAEQIIKEMKSHLDEPDYNKRYINYDIAICWYYCLLGSPEKVPDWLTEGFSPYGHAAFIENFANQMKAHYCFVTRNYPPILSYIQELKQRESFLYGRVEMLALEACIYYRMKDKQQALASLIEAYKTAAPNDLYMPFIELGKDMRTLTAFALKKKDSGIPKEWLETVSRKSASYAKRLAHIVSAYKQANSIANIMISPRETEVLSDLSHGLSRTEIAAGRNLSINTVKMVINNIYMKLGAENLADAIRIASERKIV